MKKHKIYKLILVMVGLLAVDAFISSTTAFSQMPIQTNINSYNVSPLGIYDRIQLVPRDPLTTCAPGTMYVNNINSLLYVCDTAGIFSFTDSVWKQSNASIFFKDTANLSQLYVGIGTSAPEFKLTLKNDTLPEDGGIIARGIFNDPGAVDLPSLGEGARFIWYPKKAALRAGELTLPYATYWDNVNIGNHSVAFGFNSRAKGDKSVVAGGEIVIVDASYGTILGGYINFINSDSDYSTIVSGQGNSIQNSKHSFIGGGASNIISKATPSENYSSILGGLGNNINGNWSFVGGGINNRIGPNPNIPSNYSVISGGKDNTIDGGDYNNISGGRWNNIVGSYNAILGGGSDSTGNGNSIVSNSTKSVIAGGYNNTIGSTTTSNFGTIIGGSTNTLNGNYSTIIGGGNNTITGNYSTMAGGSTNNITADYAYIGGGQQNLAAGNYATVGGSFTNSAGGMFSFIGGGVNNTANGNYSVTLGSGVNDSTGDYSWAGGYATRVLQPNTFAWSWSSGGSLNRSNTFFMNPNYLGVNGVVGIGLSAPTVTLDVNGRTQITGVVTITPAVAGPDNIQLYRVGAGMLVGKDLAEIFETSQDVEAGDVLVIDEAQKIKLKKSESAYDKKVIGVVSGAPAIVFKGNSIDISLDAKKFTKGKNPPVALSGRVPCKVTLENGPIEMGDLLTTSSTPGYAMKADRSLDKSFGKIIGRAMESFTGESSGEKTGMITIFVTLH